MNQYNDSPDCIANRLVRDVIGMKVKWFNKNTGRWKIGTIIRIYDGAVCIRTAKGLKIFCRWGFVIMPKGEGEK